MLAPEERMRPIRLVIADRRPIVLQGFASLFAAERDFAIVASCLDGAGCLKAVRTLTPDLVLIEDGFSDVTASEMLAVVKAEDIPTRLVFYTASVAQGDLAAAIAAGACCAVSMREEPGNWMQTLRLVAPSHDRATAGRAENGALGDKGLELTDQERMIMRLVAYGMSNNQIARQLKVSAGTIKARLDRISTQLEIKGRRKIATFALSRLYGGIGALAALLYALLDDAKAAQTGASGHEPTDTFAVPTADGTGEIITIKINARKTAEASAKTVQAGSKSVREENAITAASGRATQPVTSSIDIGAGSITAPALSSARPGLGNFATLMTTAVGIWFYELLNSVAHASNLGDSATVYGATAGSGTADSAAFPAQGNADASLVSFDKLAWLRPDTYDQSFAFGIAEAVLIAREGDDLQIAAASATGDSAGSDGNAHVGSGAVDAPVDHGAFEQAATTGAPGHAEHDSKKAAPGDDSNLGQDDVHGAEDGGQAGKHQGEHGSPKNDSNQGQTQSDLAHSKDGAEIAKQHAKQDLPEQASDHAHAQHDLPHAKDHAKDDAKPASDANSGHSQKESHAASANASKGPHAEASQHAGGKDKAADDSGHAQKAATLDPGDSFHFKNETAASKASHTSEVHGGPGPESNEHGPHTAANGGPTPVLDAELIGPPHPEQSAVEHGQSPQHHPMHELIV
ncbi:response regulator transcription factor [Bradyrhizobium diazoefficiens]|nr:response regulator transcription factor [Bradyrhizobium diazoefficiens]MBR0848105.1 response regulator transcription factor [Bradyrhizobium diazoefficiens]